MKMTVQMDLLWRRTTSLTQTAGSIEQIAPCMSWLHREALLLALATMSASCLLSSRATCLAALSQHHKQLDMLQASCRLLRQLHSLLWLLFLHQL